MNTVLLQATIEDYPVIQNMARFYVYDMSRYCGRHPSIYDWACPENGLYECVDLRKYFEDPTRYPFFIQSGTEKAGFVLINKIGSTFDVDWNVGEFFVLAKFQGTGIGQQIAELIFDRFPGIWETAAMIENLGACQFWDKVVNRYTNGSFTKENKIIDKPEPHEMLVFQFRSGSMKS